MSRRPKPVEYRRKREGKTDYGKRLKLLLSEKARAVFRRSLKYVWIQLVTFDGKGDKIIISAHSRELKKIGWNVSFKNLSASYLTGLLFAKKAKEANVKEVIADNGLYSTVPKSCFYAALKGIVDGGLNIPVSDKVFPPEERINGSHVKSYAELLGEKKARQFSSKLQDPIKTPEIFEEIKGKIK